MPGSSSTTRTVALSPPPGAWSFRISSMPPDASMGVPTFVGLHNTAQPLIQRLRQTGSDGYRAAKLASRPVDRRKPCQFVRQPNAATPVWGRLEARREDSHPTSDYLGQQEVPASELTPRG